MRIVLDLTDSRPIYVQIMDEVRRALVMGKLAAGDALPSVRDLASDLRVNPNTVSQAYRELERLSVVEARRGQGTFVMQSGLNGTQRKALARDVASRALRDAHRNGLDVEELIAAIRTTSTARRPAR